MTENRHILPCPRCDRKIRIPTNKGHIRFTCPDCNAPLEWSPDGSHAARDVDVEPVGVEPQAPVSHPAPIEGPLPRTQAAYYALAALAMGYATFWFSREGNGADWAPLAFSGALMFALYFAYRAVRIATRFGVWASIGLLMAAQAGLSLVLPGLGDHAKQSELAEAITPVDPELGEGHFDGRTADNTTPSQMDALMESW